MTEAIRAVEGERVEVREPRFKLIPFESLIPGASPSYLVKGLIPRVGLTVVWGPPKCGKSFWMSSVAMHVALGWEYRGRRVQQGPVVYCAFEGAEGFKARAEAYRQRFLPENPQPVPFYLSAAPMDLVKDHAGLIASIRLQLNGERPVAVMLDTLNRSLHGSESNDEDMTAYIRAADAIRDAFNCAIIVVHHCGVEGTRPRGHTALAGAVDAQLAVKRDIQNNIVVTVERMKDGPEGDTIISRLDVVEIGTDSEGDPVASCVVVPVEEQLAKPPPKRKLTPKQQNAVDALTFLCADGSPLPAAFQMPAGLRAISLDTWRTELLSRGIIEAAAGNPREEFRRLKDGLKSKYLMAERDGLVWYAG